MTCHGDIVIECAILHIMSRALSASRMRRALALLDEALPSPARLIIGGGGAMVLAYDHPISTNDIDAFCAKGGLSIQELDPYAKRIAKALAIEPDWLNGHFVTFTHVLPSDYAERLRSVIAGTRLTVDALGPEDMLIMKCFAGRDKDRSHARKLVRIANDLDVVDRQLSLLSQKRVPGAQKAADYFDDVRDEAGL